METLLQLCQESRIQVRYSPEREHMLSLHKTPASAASSKGKSNKKTQFKIFHLPQVLNLISQEMDDSINIEIICILNIDTFKRQFEIQAAHFGFVYFSVILQYKVDSNK